jgi:hypothetical protein
MRMRMTEIKRSRRRKKQGKRKHLIHPPNELQYLCYANCTRPLQLLFEERSKKENATEQITISTVSSGLPVQPVQNLSF